jgi:hypothetical protein
VTFLWSKFWQPDTDWLNTANMTNLRSLNATRLAVGIGAVWTLAFLGSVIFFWRSVWMAGDLHEAQIVSAVLMSGKEAATFAKDIFEAFLWFATAMGGFAVGGAIGKRLTDTEHRVKIEEAKARRPAPGVVAENVQRVEVPAPVTGERPALRERPTGDARVDDERGEP